VKILDFNHVSVLLNECIENLNIRSDGVYIDGTLGGAGHSLAIAQRLTAKGLLLGIDRDADAILKAEAVLHEYMDRVILIRSNFSEIESILATRQLPAPDGILLDLGVSSYQLDEPSRGFSYMHDAPLDMRMDHRQEKNAYAIVNGYSEKDLTRIILDYGEERWAKRIAEFIVAERAAKPVETTFELVSVIKKAVPKGARQDGPHPAKRTFQAIRIEVNGELEILGNSIEKMAENLNPKGRLCVITFHSLEDRIVKNTFRKLENPCTCPHDIPVCVCGKKPVAKVITKKPILPSDDEQNANHRARSAKLRVIERLVIL
jgi:16S rRNA (cytosine1402-N4)-methyltransferase